VQPARKQQRVLCQDNELSWFDWSLLDANREMLRFTSVLIALRRRHASLAVNRFFDGRPLPDRGLADITSRGLRLGEAPWSDPGGRLLRFTIAGRADDEDDLHVILNMSENAVALELPELAGRTWCLAVDTAHSAPRDIVAPDRQVPLDYRGVTTAARSVMVLEARVRGAQPDAGDPR